MNLLACLLLTLTAVSAAPHFKISDARNASLGEVPFIVSLQVHGAFDDVFTLHTCNGILIADQWVLATANCVQGTEEYNTIASVYGGFVKMEQTMGGLRKFTIDKQYIHSDFNPVRPNYPSLHDLALLKLDRKVPLDKNFNIASLPQAGAEPDYDKDFTLSGWGGFETDKNTVAYPYVLTIKDFPILNYESCRAHLLNYTNNVEENFALAEKLSLCTGPENAAKALIFDGDVGGPLTQNGVVYGLVSYILNYDANNLTFGKTPSGVYIKIEPYLNWINEIISQN